MKKQIRYPGADGQNTREINYIPLRYIFAILITLFEILAIIGIVTALCYYVPYFYLAAYVTEIFCVVQIIASDDNPDYKIPWLLCVLVLPIAGFMLYFLFYSRKLKPKYIKRLRTLKDSAPPKNDSVLFQKLAAENPAAGSMAKMLCNISESELYENTKQMYFPLGEEMHVQMLTDLKTAKKFIYLEYFIIEDGIFWNSILNILKEKAAQGVEVKVVYDDIGCMTTLPGDYSKTLAAFGIAATPFARLRGNADSEFNNRSHRKIMVIDGCIGYTGGINIADEYINKIVKHGHWKDTGIRLEGTAVQGLTKLFLIDFGINVKQMPLLRPDLFPSQTKQSETGYIIPFGDGPRPLYSRRVSKTVIQSMLAAAQHYMYMTTPYLILDNDLCQSIENAALRGVEIKIIVPHIPDKKLVFEITRSFYGRLLDAGVKIYEYRPGFIHAKSYLADDKIAVIGTVNLDYRSLVHHFENGVWMYNCTACKALLDDITNTLQKCIPFTNEMRKTTLSTRLIRSVVRIFAPLL